MGKDTFQGIPPAGLQFLSDLAENNNREWFQENKSIYQKQLLEPTKDFIVTLGERLAEIVPGIVYDTRANGQGSLMRIARDTRFSKDKTPYNPHLSMVFWDGAGSKKESPGFYLRIEPEQTLLIAGEYGFSKPMLAAFRQAVADEEKGTDLETVLAQLRSVGIEQIGGEHYKRVPRGFPADHPRSDLLRYAGLYAILPPIPQEQMLSEIFVDLCLDRFRPAVPLYTWLTTLSG